MRILWIPHTGWHIPQRAHTFCHALADRHEVHVTNWVADFTTPRDYMSRRYLRNFRYRHSWDGQIQVHDIPRISPAIYFRPFRIFNTLLFKRYVACIIKDHNIDVVVSTYLVPPPKAPRLVFDLYDENVVNWRGLGLSEYANEIDRVEHEYLRTADAVVAASSVLAEKARAGGAKGEVFLIPNGVDLDAYQCADSQRFRQEIGLQGRIVGMVGNHNVPDELNRVLDAARLIRDQEISFLIVGRGSAMAGAEKQVYDQDIKNVHFHGYVEPTSMPDVLAALDVGICPYSKTPMDDARSPMRLFAYAAAGLPTVCTDIVEVRRLQFPTVILVEETPRALADGIQAALRLPRARPPQIALYDIKQLAKQYEMVLRG